MIVIGAKGFAKELLEILYENGVHEICFFDDVTKVVPKTLYGKYPVITDIEELAEVLKLSPNFIIGVGGTVIREKVAQKIISVGGRLQSLVSNKASVGHFGTTYSDGTVILNGAIITNDVTIGEGCIINKSSILSHDVTIGNYCEVSPGARLLGRVIIDDYTSVGTNAVILPSVKIGRNCVIGAGAVVTKDVPDNQTVVGIPAKAINSKC